MERSLMPRAWWWWGSFSTAKRNMLGRKRDYWDLIENLDRLVPAAHNLLMNVRSIPDIKTAAGRGRAFIRCVLATPLH
jgi:hypothetical protein